MPDTAPAKVEDALRAVITALTEEGEALEGWTVHTEHSVEQDVEPKAIVIYTPVPSVDHSFEQGTSVWRQTIEIEFISGPQPAGSISRANMEAIATVHGAVAADRTLGGRLQDLQEQDIAGTQAEGKDVDSASVQYVAEYHTPRDDWFTIVGQGGATF